MKKAYMLFLLIVLSCQLKADSSVVIKYCSDYYNPFAWNFKWNFKYLKPLKKNQRIKITFLQKDNSNTIDNFVAEHILGEQQSEANIYWFMQKDSDTKCTLRIDVVPCKKTSSLLTFFHISPSQHELISATYQQLLAPVGKEILLAKFCEQPWNGKNQLPDNMIKKKTTVSLFNQSSEKSNNYLSVELFIKVVLIESLPTNTEKPVVFLSTLLDKDLLKLKDKIEKDFQRGQGSLPQLNAVQQEINNRRIHNVKTE
ncbi:MAG: hypothetical protein WC071_10825 [Victivallaceae bacterium]